MGLIRVITNLYDDAPRSLGLKVSQMNILIVVARLGIGLHSLEVDSAEDDWPAR